jgi:iron(III) transport system substrate-binding protein
MSSLRSTRVLAAVAAVFMLAACGGAGEGSAKAAQPGAAGDPAASTSDCLPTDDPLVDAARAEGSVVMTGTPSGEMRNIIPREFKNKYGVDVQYEGARNSETAARLRAERAANIFSHDVFTGGGDTMSNVYHAEGWLASLKEALPPAVLEDDKWVLGKPPWVDPEEDKILKLSEYVNTAIIVNTDLVNEGEIRGWKDVLDPKWKGKIVTDDPTSSGGGSNFVANIGDALGDEVVKGLYVDQQPAILRDARQELDAVGKGDYAIAWALQNAATDKAMRDGLPLAEIRPDDAPLQKTSGSALVALNNKPAHPNAAKLLVSWLACDEGNAFFAQAIVGPSTRADVPLPEGVNESDVPVAGVAYFDTYDWTFLTERKRKVQREMKELLGR